MAVFDSKLRLPSTCQHGVSYWHCKNIMIRTQHLQARPALPLNPEWTFCHESGRLMHPDEQSLGRAGMERLITG